MPASRGFASLSEKPDVSNVDAGGPGVVMGRLTVERR